MKLLVATSNIGKLNEYKTLFSELSVNWVSLKDINLTQLEIEEHGDSFEENATIKALAYCRASGLITLADDSGLVVDALGGEPGIHSARYGMPEISTDEERREKILSELKGISFEHRTARYICILAIAIPDQSVQLVQGIMEGHIAYEPQGEFGFGYDPIFVTPTGQTAAELTPAQKSEISHRGNALRTAFPILAEIVDKSGDKA